LSGGETQRIRLVNQISAELSDVLYIFDEAFVGLHPKDHQYLLDVFRQLVNNGNTVILVEHDELAIRQADFIVDIGPGAGNLGGELLFSGTLTDFLNDKNLLSKSPTQSVLLSLNKVDNVKIDKCNKEYIYIKNATKNNLKNINVRFLKSALNVVSGLSGAGKSSLIHGELEPLMKSYFDDNIKNSERLSGVEGINNLISIYRKIGKDKINALVTALQENKNG
jgi:excinuclease ABC subunit A